MLVVDAEICGLIKNSLIKLNENKSGVYVNLSFLDNETISKLETLGIRDATDLASNLSSLGEDLAANVARGLMRNSSDYSKMFFNLLRNNDSYDTAIKGLEDLIEKNASKITIWKKIYFELNLY